MDTSLLLAKILGVHLIVIGFGAFVRSKAYPKLINDFLKNRALVYITGVMMMVFGMLAVLYHNIWDGTWRTLVTLIAWLAMLKGIMYILIPHKSLKNMTKSISTPGWYKISGFVILLVGVYLVSVGF